MLPYFQLSRDILPGNKATGMIMLKKKKTSLQQFLARKAKLALADTVF